MKVLEHVRSDNLSLAWLQAMTLLTTQPDDSVGPLIVTITDMNNDSVSEDQSVREQLNAALHTQNKIERVANTIFPASLWNRTESRQLLFERFLRIWPTLIKRCKGNARGHYFQRLIAFENGDQTVNQLEHIITTWSIGNHRHSALQAAIFDPRKDHTDSRQLNFPCLHQVAFDADQHEGTLGLTAFYANQNLFLKGYGNYLGLCRLGQFMAHEMSLMFTTLHCIASKPNARLSREEAHRLLSPLNAAVAAKRSE